jgi:hypothetical protein
MPIHRFTKENAAANGRKGNASLRRQRAEQKARLEEFLSQTPADANGNARTERVLRQLDRIDRLLLTCKVSELATLATAKERLWGLIFPKPNKKPIQKPAGRNLFGGEVSDIMPGPAAPSEPEPPKSQ